MPSLEAIKTEIERSLPPSVIAAMREAGVALTLDSASDVQPVVSISDELAERELLGEMASFGKNVTGVDNTVFISAKGYARHGPRIKLAIDPPNSIDSTSETISIAIDSGEVVAGKAPPARLLKQVRRFIELNHDVLIDYWNSRFLTDELVRRLKPIK
jgi:hypothetical protein